MAHTKALSWGLVIATYQREKILPLAVDLAAKQSRPPKEIIIVDASPGWEASRDKILGEIASTAPEVRWIYVAAEKTSTTLQRNQGVSLATADILFLFDDDSLMYGDCAEQIMKIYEADPEHAIIGIQANSVRCVDVEDAAVAFHSDQRGTNGKVVSTSPLATGLLERLLSASSRQLLWKYGFLRKLLILDTKDHFIPYEGSFKKYLLPSAVKTLSVASTRIFDGCGMTFRHTLFSSELFEPLFLHYAVAEDADLSYRASRHGALLTALSAKLHHFESRSRRLPIKTIATLTGLNYALCIRRNSNNLTRDRRKYYRFMTHMLLINGIKDLANHRWKIPRARGLILAVKRAVELFRMPESALNKWYPELQAQLINRQNK